MVPECARYVASNQIIHLSTQTKIQSFPLGWFVQLNVPVEVVPGISACGILDSGIFFGACPWNATIPTTLPGYLLQCHFPLMGCLVDRIVAV